MISGTVLLGLCCVHYAVGVVLSGGGADVVLLVSQSWVSSGGGVRAVWLESDSGRAPDWALTLQRWRFATRGLVWQRTWLDADFATVALSPL